MEAGECGGQGVYRHVQAATGPPVVYRQVQVATGPEAGRAYTGRCRLPRPEAGSLQAGAGCHRSSCSGQGVYRQVQAVTGPVVYRQVQAATGPPVAGRTSTGRCRLPQVLFTYHIKCESFHLKYR